MRALRHLESRGLRTAVISNHHNYESLCQPSGRSGYPFPLRDHLRVEREGIRKPNAAIFAKSLKAMGVKKEQARALRGRFARGTTFGGSPGCGDSGGAGSRRWRAGRGSRIPPGVLETEAARLCDKGPSKFDRFILRRNGPSRTRRANSTIVVPDPPSSAPIHGLRSRRNTALRLRETVRLRPLPFLLVRTRREKGLQMKRSRTRTRNRSSDQRKQITQQRIRRVERTVNPGQKQLTPPIYYASESMPPMPSPSHILASPRHRGDSDHLGRPGQDEHRQAVARREASSNSTGDSSHIQVITETLDSLSPRMVSEAPPRPSSSKSYTCSERRPSSGSGPPGHWSRASG